MSNNYKKYRKQNVEEEKRKREVMLIEK